MNNVIENKDGEAFGFFEDLREGLKAELVDAIENNALDAVGHYSEIFEELERLKDYDGIIKLSDHNGMGWTATKYQGDAEGSGDYEKLAEGVEALITLHRASVEELAAYLRQYVIIKEK